jgi:type II secretory pathway pseudopilin PulG
MQPDCVVTNGHPVRPDGAVIELHRRPGNTLLELVCGLAIIAVFAAAGTPRFAKAVAARRAEAAARRLAADLEWLRSTARTTSTTQTMSFNTAANTYSLTGFVNPDFPAQGYTVNLASTTYKSSIASLNLGGATTLSFNGYGIPSAGGTIVVQSGKSTHTVTLDGVSGIVTWQ